MHFPSIFIILPRQKDGRVLSPPSLARTRPHAPLFCAPFRRGMSPCCRRSLQQEIPERPRPWSVSQIIYNLNSIVSCVLCPEPVLGKRSFRSRKLKVNVESTAVYFVLEPGPCVRCPETAGAKRLCFLRNLPLKPKKDHLLPFVDYPDRLGTRSSNRNGRFVLACAVSFRVTFRSFRARVVLVSCPFRLVWRRLGLLALR